MNLIQKLKRMLPKNEEYLIIIAMLLVVILYFLVELIIGNSSLIEGMANSTSSQSSTTISKDSDVKKALQNLEGELKVAENRNDYMTTLNQSIYYFEYLKLKLMLDISKQDNVNQVQLGMIEKIDKAIQSYTDMINTKMPDMPYPESTK